MPDNKPKTYLETIADEYNRGDYWRLRVKKPESTPMQLFDLVLAQLVFLRNKFEEYFLDFRPSNIKKYQKHFFFEKVEPNYKIEPKMKSSEKLLSDKRSQKLRASDEKHPNFFIRTRDADLSNVEQMLRKYKRDNAPSYTETMKSMGGLKR